VPAVTPVTPSKGSIPKEQNRGVTAGVICPEERAAILELDCGLPFQIAIALARLEPTVPTEMIHTLARFADECGARSRILGWTIEDLFGLSPERSLACALAGWINDRRSIRQDRDHPTCVGLDHFARPPASSGVVR
jgi:hypothetical protein